MSNISGKEKAAFTLSLAAIAISVLAIYLATQAEDGQSTTLIVGAVTASGGIAAGIGAIFTALTAAKDSKRNSDEHAERMDTELRLRTLEYASNGLSEAVAPIRTDIQIALGHIREGNLNACVESLKKNTKGETESAFWQYWRILNRIGWAYQNEALDRSVIEGLWKSEWWQEQRELFETYLREVEGKNDQDLTTIYPSFHDMAYGKRQEQTDAES